MKRNDLIELLKTLPEDAEVVLVKGDDILGDYSYSTFIDINQTEGLQDDRGSIWTTYSNYAGFGKKKVIVWEIA